MFELNIGEIVRKQREYFDTDITKTYYFRLEALKNLKANFIKYEKEIYDALKCDLRRCDFEIYISEYRIVIEELNNTIRNLSKWMKPEKVANPLAAQSAKSLIYKEPYGVVLIIAPWNYPVQTVFLPLIGAIAGGNCAVVKPSEFAINTAMVVDKIIGDSFLEEYVKVINGELEVSKALLKENFDYIFFTGSTRVGKIVMKAAAENLTPVTLELGGKNPTVVLPDTDLEVAAKRIAWGKFLNAGQTCIAPDYLYIHEKIYEPFLEELIKAIVGFYGEYPELSEDYGRIINENHFDRLLSLTDSTKITFGGEINKDDKYISPTILENISWDDPIMKEEIFGPILPIFKFDDVDKLINKLRKKDKALAFYLFTEDREMKKKFIESISFGGGCINDTLFHAGIKGLPFAGVGASGMGNYHGKYSFDTFVHRKGVLENCTCWDFNLRYPPYEGKMNKAKMVF